MQRSELPKMEQFRAKMSATRKEIPLPQYHNRTYDAADTSLAII